MTENILVNGHSTFYTVIFSYKRFSGKTHTPFAQMLHFYCLITIINVDFAPKFMLW